MFSPNEDQRRAIQAPSDQPVRIVAGAGTGKTEVISQRFVHLLTHGDLRPDQILVLTFSEKAAAEMRARIFRAVSSAELGYHRIDLANAPISTFHSFGARLLRDNSLQAGIDTGKPFLTEADTTLIIDTAVMAFLDHDYEKAYTFNPLEKDVYTWEDGGPIRTAVSIIDQLRNQAAHTKEFTRQWKALEELSDRHAVVAPLVGHIYHAYQAMLATRGQLDFDRLIMGAVELLEGEPGLRRRIHTTFRAILVDEYQDANYAQERLLRAVARKGRTNVTVVGDPRQAIYVWREARVENIAGFPGAGRSRIEAPLSKNWRSVKPILSVANKSIEGYDFGDPTEFEADRILEPARPETSSDQPVVTLQVFNTREAEAEAVAKWLGHFHDTGLPFRDMAILIRARTYLGVYLEAMDRAGIPYDVSAGDAFYTRPEIMDVVHLLRLCIDPMDRLALVVTLVSPVVGLSQGEVARLDQADDEADLFWQVIHNPVAYDVEESVIPRLQQFVHFWKEAQRQRWLRSPSSFTAWVLEASGLERYIAGLKDLSSGRALHKLLAVVHTYDTENPGDALEDLVAYLRQLVKAEPGEKTPELTSDANAVAVMTTHASKGLEFPVVLAVDNRQRVSPTKQKSPFHEPGVGLVFPEDDDQDVHYVTRMRHLRNEARCLWYVALTRAKNQMVVTAVSPDGPEDGELFKPVRTLFQELWNREVVQPTGQVERIIQKVES